MFLDIKNAIGFNREGQFVKIEPWGKNAFRVRAAMHGAYPDEKWALIDAEKCEYSIEKTEDCHTITNGKIKAVLNKYGKITFYNQNGKQLLKEHWLDDTALLIDAREFKPIVGGDYTLTARFEPVKDEKIYGMGQYQQAIMDLKGCEIELAHRNSQASVPFYVSSHGYGFLWNNPAHGRATFAKNVTLWTADSTKFLDYWICAGDTPKEIEQQYATATGKTPMMPQNAMGFWQCKLRYRTQEELLEVAREYKKRGLPLDVIVVDFFHWPFLGDFRFNEKFWPDPDAMIKEINDMGTQVAVSIWPFIEDKSENYREMRENGYLVTSERGLPFSHTYIGNSIPFDATNADARRYVWEKAKKNYYDKGVRIFWLDEAEPEFEVYDFENYRYSIGPVVQSGNIYPSRYAQGFYEGRAAEGETEILNLIRCAWAGSQKYGTLVWSGDVRSSFDSFKQQICAGLNMAMSGIPWWTTDIGGFFGGNVNDPEFKELLIRWFEYGTFCPVMRLHGDRQPKFPGTGLVGGEKCGSGSPNEVWSYGEEVYKILKPYLFIREAMKPYITQIMQTAHTDGDPVIRPLFYEFPDDKTAWDVEDSFMFGDKILVCPVSDYKQREKTVYLPQGAEWTDVWSGKKYNGGQYITVDAPLEKLPLFARDSFDASFITKAFDENY